MELLLIAGLVAFALFARASYRHNNRRKRAVAFASIIKPQYLHAVCHRTNALAVEHAAHKRPYFDQLELLVAIAERIEVLSLRPMHARFRIEARDHFIQAIRNAETVHGEKIRVGLTTGMDAVDCPDDYMSEVLAHELGIRRVPRAALMLPDDPNDLFETGTSNTGLQLA